VEGNLRTESMGRGERSLREKIDLIFETEEKEPEHRFWIYEWSGGGIARSSPSGLGRSRSPTLTLYPDKAKRKTKGLQYR